MPGWHEQVDVVRFELKHLNWRAVNPNAALDAIDPFDRVLTVAPRDQVAKKLRDAALARQKEAEAKATTDAPPTPGESTP